jgi:hypothetical protein
MVYTVLCIGRYIISGIAFFWSLLVVVVVHPRTNAHLCHVVVPEKFCRIARSARVQSAMKVEGLEFGSKKKQSLPLCEVVLSYTVVVGS